MNWPMKNLLMGCVLALAFAAGPAALAARIEVQVDMPGHRISPTLWGIFFEDINCSADGGVYSELVRNRSFEDAEQPKYWSVVAKGTGKGELLVTTNPPSSGTGKEAYNRRALQLRITGADQNNPVGVANDGYWGIAIHKGGKYDLSLFARGADGFDGPLEAELQSTEGKVYARQSIAGVGSEWRSFRVTLSSSDTDPKARLVLTAAHTGSVFLDMVSLFPQVTWKEHGLRPDLMNLLDGLKPSFVRFPGGCWVEGEHMSTAYRWKQTIGAPRERRTQWNLWNYWATHGLGFHEYLQMCEDLGAEPLFVINCGMAHRDSIALDQLPPFVQDALDAIEYCNGSPDTTYGALRARNGHPAPFHLKYMEIGNENGGPIYYSHWAEFYKAIKAKYPKVTLIANEWAGGHPRNVPPELVDEHYYDSPEWFMSHANQYDQRDRNGPKVYIGEYAVTRGCGQGNLRGAIGEAAFMTGIERNSDIVVMASYAPLFANVNYKRWNPDLICFDGSRAYGLPSYYVQKLFSQNRGDVVLPVTVESENFRIGSTGGAIGVGTWKTKAEFKDIKVTKDGRTLFSSNFTTAPTGWQQLGEGQWAATNGALAQYSLAENVRAVIGEKSWKNYTLSLKARKLGGDEGFLILFNVQNAEEKSWWNIGGWGNTRHAIEMGGVNSHDVQGAIETGRWYDIRIETSDSGIKCYLDNQLVHDASYPVVSSLYASATRETSSREVIVKIVNAANHPVETELRLNGAKKCADSATAQVLTSAASTDENSLDQPERVAPTMRKVPVKDAMLRTSFPANSLTILRIPTGTS